MNNIHCPVLGFVAYSGTGKTTLLKKIITKLKDKKIKIGVIKHAHHKFDIDIPGKDSYELRHAGACQMLVASKHRWALITETISELDEPNLSTLVAQLNHSELGIILVEGFKHECFDKIELHRSSLDKPYLYQDDNNIIALICDEQPSISTDIPIFDINDIVSITNFIINKYSI